MAFNFFKWLLRARDAPEAVTVEDMFDLFTDCYIRELAFQSCVNLTANAVSKCEIKTFLGGKEVKGREYYLWNLSPNQNQDRSMAPSRGHARLNSARPLDGAVAESYQRRLLAQAGRPALPGTDGPGGGERREALCGGRLQPEGVRAV